MGEQQRPDDLARLRAEFDAFRARAERRERHRHGRRRSLPLALAALLVALVPLATLAANPFTDLVPGSVHNPNIDAIDNAGITTGCVPNAEYCPTDLVTRQEMASFLARTAGLGGNPPVANALPAQDATALGGQPPSYYQPAAQPIANATTAQNATNAATVGGYAPSGLVRAARGTGPGVSPLTTTFQTLATVAITVPGPGVVLVDSTFIAGSSPAGNKVVEFRLRDTTSGTVSPASEIAKTVGAGELYEVTVNPIYAFPRNAVGPRTFVLEGRAILGTINTVRPIMVALYAPFGNAGEAGVLAIDPEAPEPTRPDGRPSTER